MQIEVHGRNLQVTEELRELISRRFEKVSRQVSELAVLRVELHEEHNPSNPLAQKAEATLFLKGVTLCAKDAARDMPRAINLTSEELSRQVKRVRDKRRGPRAGNGTGPMPYGDAHAYEPQEQPAAGT